MNQTRITVRPEHLNDIAAIHAVNAAAFGRIAEADLVDALRASGHLTLSLVAELECQIVGHIAFSPAHVTSSYGDWTALALGPLAVSPPHQRTGVGSTLVSEGLQLWLLQSRN